MSFFAVIIFASNFLGGCSSTEKIDEKKLLGIWNMLPDSSSQSFFNGQNSIDYVRGYKQAAYDYKIIDDILIQTHRGSQEIYQWRIIKLTDDSLVIRHIRTNFDRHYWRSNATVIVQRNN